MQHKNSDSWQLAPRGRTEAGDEWLVNKDLCVELKGDDTRTWLTESELKMLLAAVRKRDTGNSTGLMEGFGRTVSDNPWDVSLGQIWFYEENNEKEPIDICFINDDNLTEMKRALKNITPEREQLTMHKFKTSSGHTWSVCTDGHVHVETNEGTLCLDSLDVLAMDAMLSDSDPQLKDSKCDLRPTHNL